MAASVPEPGPPAAGISAGGVDPRRLVVGTGTAPAGAPPATIDRPPTQAAPDGSPAPSRRGSPSEGGSAVRRRLKRVLLVSTVVVVVVSLGTLWWGYRTFERIETVALDLASERGTNYLIVGSDTRDGVDPSDPNAGAILGPDVGGGVERSDTILILRIADGESSMLSVPRDLYVTIAETGDRGRINAAFNGGPQRLISTLRQELGLPIHHYLEVDFVSFASMVDALGGITIDFPHPAIDTHSGLDVPEAGPQRLDGTMALAYVRSRFYTEVIDGRQVSEGNGDLGRVVRQQQFLAAVTHAIGSNRNPFTLVRTANALAGGMRIDDELSFLDAIGLLRRFRGLEPLPHSLPTSPFRTSGGAEVLSLVQPGSDEVLALFGSDGARAG